MRCPVSPVVHAQAVGKEGIVWPVLHALVQHLQALVGAVRGAQGGHRLTVQLALPEGHLVGLRAGLPPAAGAARLCEALRRWHALRGACGLLREVQLCAPEQHGLIGSICWWCSCLCKFTVGLTAT